ncbi:MAG TPA: hypothetical protein O0X25_01785 [Methanocorpusculum sp.]|nr:hypothetical protein [Methanocorpusculum sp.]HJJ39728.1 hypothetical protein [Methanocorpusculum sp.]HJJ49337.1 hypothetical protein [Methanocorpusculum sp.]HJJ56619.1 hypothetical protein [Methanocorpusculum sp.]
MTPRAAAPTFTDDTILQAAIAVSVSEDGTLVTFTSTDIRRHILSGMCRRLASDQRASGLTGSRVQAVLAKHTDKFQANYSEGTVRRRIRNYSRIYNPHQSAA